MILIKLVISLDKVSAISPEEGGFWSHDDVGVGAGEARQEFDTEVVVGDVFTLEQGFRRQDSEFTNLMSISTWQQIS